MKNWIIELVTNDILCNAVEIQAQSVKKINHHTLLIDGVNWHAPEALGMSFAEVSCVDDV